MSRSLYKPFNTVNQTCISIIPTKVSSTSEVLVGTSYLSSNTKRLSTNFFKYLTLSPERIKQQQQLVNFVKNNSFASILNSSLIQFKIGKKTLCVKKNVLNLLKGILGKDAPLFVSFKNTIFITPNLCGKRVAFYNGKVFSTFIVRRSMLGYSFNNFIKFKRTGNVIHLAKNIKKRKIKK